MSKYKSIQRLESVLNDISDMEKWIKELNKTIEDEVLPEIVRESGENMLEAISEVYWRFTQINCNILAKGFGFTSYNKLQKTVIPFDTNLDCEKCNERIIVDSRSSNSGYLSERGHFFDYVNGQFIHTHWKILCQSCRNDLRDVRNKFGNYNDESFRELNEIREKHEAEMKEERRQWFANLNLLKSMPYKNYLKTEHWLNRRKKHLESANFRCQVCNRNENTLDVHHRTYERRGEELFTDLIVLCRSCHDLFHKNNKIT